jgi:hypothetical protein
MRRLRNGPKHVTELTERSSNQPWTDDVGAPEGTDKLAINLIRNLYASNNSYRDLPNRQLGIHDAIAFVEVIYLLMDSIPDEVSTTALIAKMDAGDMVVDSIWGRYTDEFIVRNDQFDAGRTPIFGVRDRGKTIWVQLHHPEWTDEERDLLAEAHWRISPIHPAMSNQYYPPKYIIDQISEIMGEECYREPRRETDFGSTGRGGR